MGLALLPTPIAPCHTMSPTLNSGCTFSQVSRVPLRFLEFLLQLWASLRTLPYPPPVSCFKGPKEI